MCKVGVLDHKPVSLTNGDGSEVSNDGGTKYGSSGIDGVSPDVLVHKSDSLTKGDGSGLLIGSLSGGDGLGDVMKTVKGLF